MTRHAFPSVVPFRGPISPGGRSVVIRRPTMRWPEGQDRPSVHHKSSWVVRRQSDDRQFACPAIRIRFRQSSHVHRLGLNTGSPGSEANSTSPLRRVQTQLQIARSPGTHGRPEPVSWSVILRLRGGFILQSGNDQDNRVPMIDYPFIKREPIGTSVHPFVIRSLHYEVCCGFEKCPKEMQTVSQCKFPKSIQHLEKGTEFQ